MRWLRLRLWLKGGWRGWWRKDRILRRCRLCLFVVVVVVVVQLSSSPSLWTAQSQHLPLLPSTHLVLHLHLVRAVLPSLHFLYLVVGHLPHSASCYYHHFHNHPYLYLLFLFPSHSVSAHNHLHDLDSLVPVVSTSLVVRSLLLSRDGVSLSI